jgi:cytochrome c oxidase assembly protein subunit 15
MGLTTVTSRRISPRAFERISMLAVVCLGLVIVTGAAVRLTGSGLGCPQWPACEGGHVVAPMSFYAQVEFLNRVTTLAVSVAISVAALGAFLRTPRRRDLSWLSVGLILGLVTEIVLGGETVRHRLNPALVMAHFLLSMLILWDAVVLHHRSSLPDDEARRPLAGPGLVRLSRLMCLMVAATVIAGTVVTGAGPHSGANAGDGRITRWHLDLHRVTQIHGTAAMATLAVVVAAWWLLRSQGASAEARHRLQLVVEALAAQVAIGYTQYFTGVPAVLVAFHIVGAVCVWTAVLRFALVLSSGGGTADRPSAPDAPIAGWAASGPRSPAQV